MRCAYWLALAALVLVLACGCLQPAANTPAPTLTPQFIVIPSTTVPVVATTVAEKHLSFDVTKSEKAVTITLKDSPDTADLVALDVLINNQDGSKIKRTIVNPVVGFPYVFTYMGLANPTVVNIVGTFKGGYQQTVLMYYFP